MWEALNASDAEARECETSDSPRSESPQPFLSRELSPAAKPPQSQPSKPWSRGFSPKRVLSNHLGGKDLPKPRKVSFSRPGSKDSPKLQQVSFSNSPDPCARERSKSSGCAAGIDTFGIWRTADNYTSLSDEIAALRLSEPAPGITLYQASPTSAVSPSCASGLEDWRRPVTLRLCDCPRAALKLLHCLPCVPPLDCLWQRGRRQCSKCFGLPAKTPERAGNLAAAGLPMRTMPSSVPSPVNPVGHEPGQASDAACCVIQTSTTASAGPSVPSASRSHGRSAVFGEETPIES